MSLPMFWEQSYVFSILLQAINLKKSLIVFLTKEYYAVTYIMVLFIQTTKWEIEISESSIQSKSCRFLLKRSLMQGSKVWIKDKWKGNHQRRGEKQHPCQDLWVLDFHIATFTRLFIFNNEIGDNSYFQWWYWFWM